MGNPFTDSNPTKTAAPLAAVSPELQTNESFDTRFAALKEAVLARKPVLRDILQKHGSKSLYHYALDYFDVNEGPGLNIRREEFLGTFKTEVTRLLGGSVAESATAQLRKYYFVSTADHHGPICDRYFINSNLVPAITAMSLKDPQYKNLIVLSCASISVDNDTFPRGLTFHSNTADRELILNRLPFFSSHERPALICLLRALGKSEIEKIKKSVTELQRTGNISPNLGDQILDLINDVYNQDSCLGLSNYSDQITITNYTLWQKFLGQPDYSPPDLIYIELERIVTTLILEHHLEKDTIINRFLFDERYHQLALKYFDGIIGAFVRSTGVGSYLFWAIPKGERYRVGLVKEGNELVSMDGRYRCELTPEAIGNALRNQEIIPAMMLDFIVLACYYGLKCLGGFSQVNYLTDIKAAYIKILEECNHQAEIELVNPVQTKELCEGLTIAYGANAEGKITLASALDIGLYSDAQTWPTLMKEASTITLEEAINPMFPSFYKVSHNDHERDQNLYSLTAADIIKLTGLDKKILPCVRIP